MIFSGVGSRNKFDKILRRWRIKNFIRTPAGQMGHYRYNISSDAGLTTQQHTLLQDKQINPFSFILETAVKLDDQNGATLILSDEEFNLRQILSAWLKLKLNLNGVSFQVSTTIADNNLIGTIFFTPLIFDEYIYMDRYQAANVEIDLSKLVGHGLISANPLVDKALKKYPLDEVIYVEGLYMYKLNIALPRSVLEDRLEVINNEIFQLSNNGQCVVKSTMYFTAKNWLATEVAQLWDFRFGPDRIADLSHDTKRFITDHTFGTSLSVWMEKTLLNIVLNKTPQVLVTGSWATLTDMSNKSKRLYLAAILAYRDVVAKNPCLYDLVPDIQVLANLTICVPVFELVDLQLFEESLLIQLSRLHNYHISKERRPLAVEINGFWISDPSLEIIPESFVSCSNCSGPEQFKMAAAAERGLYQFFAHQSREDKLSGTVVLHGDYWNVDLGDRGQRSLFRINQDLDSQSEQQIRDNLQQRWEQGEFLTRWGRFMFEQHNIYSIFMTRPVDDANVTVEGLL